MILLTLIFACSSAPSTDAEVAPKDRPALEVEPTENTRAPRGTPSSPADGEPEFGLVHKDCKDVPENDAVEGPDCLSGTIACGDTRVGHTLGGTNNLTTKFYEKKFCTPATTDHDSGDERVYRLDMPDGDWTADVYLDTPCADLDLAAIKWTGDTCPNENSAVGQCEMTVREGGRREHVRLSSRDETTWLVAVEGKGTQEGAFALVVTCRPGL